MKVLNPQKVFVQYRDALTPYNPIISRKYTITHSDTTAELFVFISNNFAEDKITNLRDEVRVAWQQNKTKLVLMGSVLVDGTGVVGKPEIRNKIFYNEMPTALQALRQADRFLFHENPTLNSTPILIHFISSNNSYDKVYSFGVIGDYR
ncbi:MAG: staygreen family protein [Lachnospiraceae bacterium]|nr:staygreen family protein [Lachnospiraceae bacterium]